MSAGPGLDSGRDSVRAGSAAWPAQAALLARWGAVPRPVLHPSGSRKWFIEERDSPCRGGPPSGAALLAPPTVAEAAGARIAGISATMLMALFFASLLMPIEPRIGPIRMTPYNALQIVLFIPLLLRFRNDPSNRIVLLDVLMVLHVLMDGGGDLPPPWPVAGCVHRQPDGDDLRRIPDRAGDGPQRRGPPALLHLLLLVAW